MKRLIAGVLVGLLLGFGLNAVVCWAQGPTEAELRSYCQVIDDEPMLVIQKIATPGMTITVLRQWIKDKTELRLLKGVLNHSGELREMGAATDATTIAEMEVRRTELEAALEG